MRHKLKPLIKCKRCKKEGVFWKIAYFNFDKLIIKSFWYECSVCKKKFCGSWEFIKKEQFDTEKSFIQ